ncbi:EF-hand domain-containing member C2 [Chamberlinius hualienensis]
MMFGIRPSETPIKLNYHKTHHFEWKNNVLVSSKKIQCKLPNLKYESRNGAEALKFGVPDWITFNNQILKFYAASFDKRGSSPLVRPYFYHILYFLEDDSIQIIDKSKCDDLKFQGAHLKRHQIPKQNVYINAETDYYRLDDFNINKELTIYNKTYHIYDCDQYTRGYLTSLGVQVPDRDEELHQLQTIHLYNRQNMHNRPQSCPNSGLAKKKPQRQFLEFDGKVLNFKCLQIRHNEPPEKLLLLYYLADDSIEIREYTTDSTLSCLRMPSRSNILLHRSKITKHKTPCPIPGDNKDVEYYTDQDLIIGSKINIWGRILLIFDCDELTKHFFNIKYGLDLKPIPLDEIGITVEEKQHRTRRSQSAMPTTIRRQKLPYEPEFVKFIKYGPTANDSHILRFLAKFHGNKISSWDAKRRFVISYHLVDDTFTVYEKPERNAGQVGGIIMQRCKAIDQMSTGRPLKASDFYVGAALHLNGRSFKLIDSDEYTLSYMEKNADEFSTSHRLFVLAKLKRLSNGNVKRLKSVFAGKDLENTGHIDEQTFSQVLFEFQVENENLSEQEVITLKRSYSIRKATDSKNYINPIYAIQNELRAQHFTEFDLLNSYIKSRDFTKCGRMSESNIARLCMAYPLPVKKFVVDQALKSLEIIDDGIDYEQFINAINWRNYPVSVDDCQPPKRSQVASVAVDYKRLIKEMEELNVNLN